MRDIEFSDAIHLGGDWDETQVVVTCSYDAELEEPDDLHVYIPCAHEGCKIHRLEITSVITPEQWTDLEGHAQQAVLMDIKERRVALEDDGK